ncbi:MAG: class I SAM-dependent methyltransferase [Ignavibacteriaceae bacterium]
MPDKQEVIYSRIASIYQHLMRKVNYDVWAEYLFMILQPHIRTNPRVIEIAGGEGNISFYFEKEFGNYILTDLSHAMLKFSESTLPRVACDMRALPFKSKFDLVLMIFDSINYLMTKKDLEIAFSEISSILAPGGIFTFDASLEENSKKHIAPHIEQKKTGGYQYTHTSAYNPVTKIHRNHFVLKEPDGREYRESHQQRIYTIEDFFMAIERSGLYVLAVYDAFTMNKPRKNSKRVQFILKKVNKDA